MRPSTRRQLREEQSATEIATVGSKSRPTRTAPEPVSPLSRTGRAELPVQLRVHLAGCTSNPSGAWVTQQACNLGFMGLFARTRFLIHDRDSKFSAAFDKIFRSEGIKVIQTPIRAPQANAYAERCVRTVRAECLDWLLIIGRRHLEHVLRSTRSSTTASARTADSRCSGPNRPTRSGHRRTRRSSAETDSAD